MFLPSVELFTSGNSFNAWTTACEMKSVTEYVAPFSLSCARNLSRSVMSTSTVTKKCGVVVALWVSRCAIICRILLIGFSFAASSLAADGMRGCWQPFVSKKAFTSFSTTRPPGPVPVICEGLMPSLPASAAARGLILNTIDATGTGAAVGRVGTCCRAFRSHKAGSAPPDSRRGTTVALVGTAILGIASPGLPRKPTVL